MPSAKDVDIYKMSADKLPQKGLSKKEKAQNNVLSAQNNMTNARTFAFNAEEAKKERDFNSAEAKLSREWQKMMSDTSHFREVQDLKKAGLNPVLSANTGAQSYTTSAASASHASGSADSAASAIAAYGSGYMNSQATKYSANQSAAAMRYSANMSYAAAAMSAQAQMYAADRSLEGTKYNADQAYASSWPGMIYKAMNGLKDSMTGKKSDNAFTYFFDALKEAQKSATKKPEFVDLTKMIANGDIRNVNDLTKNQYNLTAMVIEKLGFSANNMTINAYISALKGNDKAAQNLFLWYMQKHPKLWNSKPKGESRNRK